MTDALASTRKALGRYEILGEIARGAMGVVYKARDPLIDRVVAIKTVALGLSDAETEAFERRFFREAKSAGRLNHPNVVTIHDVGKCDDVAYIAMEFLAGQSLREILDSGVVLPPARIAGIAAEIADGLAFAHHNEVVHRDVKPANIMVLDSGAIKITDFGIALLPTGTRTLAGNVFGSPRYTSPEQIMGRPVDGRSDIFSLGAVVYEMLTGLAPFDGGDLNTILKQVLSDPTPAPSSHNPKLPRAFDHIVGKALAKDPNDRYQDAADMARDLRNFDSPEFESVAPSPLPALEHPTHPFAVADLGPPPDVPDSPPPPTNAHAEPRPWRSRRAMWATAAVAVAAIAIVAALGWRDRPLPAAARESAANVAKGNVVAPVTPASAPAGSAAAPAASPGAAPMASAAGTPAATSASEPATVARPAGAKAGASVPLAAVTPGAPPPPAGGTSEPPTPARTAAAPARPTGRILFAITPWGEIHVDGRKRGLAPPMHELRVPAGKHVVEIRNANLPPYRETVEVAADGTVHVKHKFQ